MHASTQRTDALVIGAGPVGLWQVFQLGLLELQATLVDALPHVGGQCAELYPDKPIYDIPGLPCVSGRELVQRLQQQIAPFHCPLHLGQLVSTLQPGADGRWLLTTSAGLCFDAGVVIIAAGAGAFLPRSLKLDGLDTLPADQLSHHCPATDDARLDGRQVLVLGDEDQALLGAADLADSARCASVTLLHRRDAFRASDAARARLQAARDAGRLQFVAGQPLQAQRTEQGRLQGMQIVDTEGQTRTLPCDLLLPLLGLSPHLGPLTHWGLALERRQLQVDTATFQTSQPGVYAVGDINTYPGKKKLLLCGFHEATLAAFAAAQHLRPDQRVLLQYTTTSPRLHQLLGVAPAPSHGQT